MKIFEAFAGYGSQAMSLRRAEKNFTSVGISEIDKYAIIAYDAVHGQGESSPLAYEDMRLWLESRNIGMDYKTGRNTLKKSEVEPLYLACQRINNYGDISSITPASLPDMDLFTYSFPCQDISAAGKQAGLERGTRSGLLWECEKIIREKKPACLFMENVKPLVGKKFKPFFDEWCAELENMGYTNKWKVVNAKKDGIPQNRERVFMISYLGSSEFQFPPEEPLVKKLKDVLERNVDESYYLSEKMLAGFKAHNKNHEDKGTGFTWRPRDLDGIASCLRANAALCPTDNTIRVSDNIIGHSGTGGERGFVYGTDGIVGALSATDYKQPKQIAIGAAQRGRSNGQQVEVNKQEVSNALTTVQKDSLVYIGIGHHPTSKKMEFNGYHDKESPCLIATDYKAPKTVAYSNGQDFRIRKLTPKEYFRLMDVKDEDFEKIKAALIRVFYNGKDKANSQLYKMAGNSIVVRCMEKIWRWMEFV